jgi:hypothetical protein
VVFDRDLAATVRLDDRDLDGSIQVATIGWRQASKRHLSADPRNTGT